MIWTRICAALALAAVGVALGCGGSGENKDKEAAVASRECPAAPAAMSGQPTLPTGFPQPAEVTYTGQVAKGPTSVVKGYFAGDIDEAFDTYKTPSRTRSRSRTQSTRRSTPRSSSRAAARKDRSSCSRRARTGRASR